MTRRPWARAPAPAGSAAVAEPAEPSLGRLRTDGWILPWGLEGTDRRRWTMIGPVDAATATTVDPRGLVTPCSHEHGWSLDWWVGADDRWHLPAREAGVRQRLVDDAPVVETTMRIPGGDAVHRVFATRGSRSVACDHWVVVEVENRSRLPFALALSVRPFTPDGVTAVDGVELEPVAGGPTHLVGTGGEAAMLIARRPARVAVSHLGEGDVAATVLAGGAVEAWPEELPHDARVVTAAFVVPVPHTATVRVVLPRVVWPPERAEQLRWPDPLPSADAVARGWAVMTRRGARFDVPDERLAALVAANRRHLLVAFGVDDIGPTVRAGTGWEATPTDPTDAATILGAADRAGFGDEVGRVLATWPTRFSGLWHGHRRAHVPRRVRAATGLAATGAVLVAIGEHGRLSPGPSLDDLLPEVVAAVAVVDRAEQRRRFAHDANARRWCQLGCALAADGLAAVGQPAAAVAEVRAVAERLGDAAGPPAAPDLAGPTVGVRAVAATARRLVAATDPSAADLLAWLIRAASPTGTWPTEVDGATLAGVGPGPGHDAVAGAMVLDVVRDLLVRETVEGLAFLSVLPAGWYGQGVEVHEAPTARGTCSYAVRWHGRRPALLWDLVTRGGTGSVILTAPGLDPGWRTSEARGEALLASTPVPRPLPGASFA